MAGQHSTAIFRRIYRGLKADFDLGQFEHLAIYNEETRGIEMHLRLHTKQGVSIPKVGLKITLDFAETSWKERATNIRTENYGRPNKRDFRVKRDGSTGDCRLSKACGSQNQANGRHSPYRLHHSGGVCSTCWMASLNVSALIGRSIRTVRPLTERNQEHGQSVLGVLR